MTNQAKKMEEEISKITSSNRGHCGKVFKMREVVVGSKKNHQEAQVIKDPTTGDLVTSSNEIKKVTLQYCLDVLRDNDHDEDFEELSERKNELLKDIIENNDGDFEISEELFYATVKKLEIKEKNSYSFLVKAGDLFKGAVFNLCKRILDDEDIPERFFLTLLIQLYKGKGSAQDLGNSRFLHMKDWLPRVCEAMVVTGGLRDTILHNSTKFQIGGQPGMRTQFHLFTVKSIMGIREKENSGVILTVADIKKFFDKESLTDACLSMDSIGVDRRALRLWYLLNSRCTITAMTGAGVTEPGEAGPVVGQGSSGAALVSQRYLDHTIDYYFKDSSDEDYYGELRLQPLLFQDDLIRSTVNVANTRAGNTRLDTSLKEMALESHPTKSGYLVCGSRQFKKLVEEETKEDPIMLGSIPLQRKAAVTYLGDELSEGGLAASVDATIEAREAKVKGAIYELKYLCEDYRMQVVGGMLGAICIFNSCIVSSLLTNCSVWVKITKKSINRLDALQHLFVRTLLHLPDSTPVSALRAITGLLGMQWRVWQEKLMLVLAIRQLGDDTLARQVFDQQVAEGWPGLAEEATDICSKIGLPDICLEEVDKKEVKEAIYYHHYAALRKELGNKEKCKELMKCDLRKPQPYLATSCLAEARMGARVQLRMVRCPGNMANLYRGRMECEACEPWREEGEEAPVCSQEHLQTCRAYRFLQREHCDMDNDFCVLTRYFMDLMWIRA